MVAGLASLDARAQPTTSADQALEEQLRLQRAIAAELTEKVRQLQAELARAHTARQEAVGATSDLRARLQRLEQTTRDGSVSLELERARAAIAEEALTAQSRKLDQLEAQLTAERQQRASLEGADSAAAKPEDPVRPTPVATGSIGKGVKATTPRRPAKTRPQPAALGETDRCLQRVMSGQVSWGGGRSWHRGNAAILCNGTRDAGRTVTCFRTQLAASGDWRDAITACRVD